MNEVLNTLTSHRSFRQYKDKPVEEEHLEDILQAAQAAPTWIHGQQVSVIVIKNQDKKKQLASYCGNQEHIRQAPVFLVFCADFYRAKLASELEGMSFEVVNDTDALLVGATDVGISMSNAIVAAESIGLGTVPIGGIRRNPLGVIELLEIPKYVIPIAGLCVGYPSEDPGLNPRLPKEAFRHDENYNSNQTQYIKSYNEIFKQHQLKRTNGKHENNWSYRISKFYQEKHYNNQYPDVPKMLHQQGFVCKDLK
ncbi:NADPH-dependent oxidoreductase [Metabacillus halosaccharovorans]|uniref:NADPH-dependent oxidoreductase n=1 Tax=Metabacillus halosaccharovorans TaxID=930124 RepID=UPI0009954C59|nr:NADPH-dependent oxidoreductase [Metabacillus halosaccharovorans]